MALPLLRIPGSSSIPFVTTKPHSLPSRSLRKTTVAAAELQTPVGVLGRTDFRYPNVEAPSHKVKVHDRERGIVHEFLVPEDQYILHTAESQDITLPFACRHGCCTSCAVRVKSGKIRQPEALGISAELREQGYALLCVSFPCSDLEVETQDEDEVTSNIAIITCTVYWLQFGRYFARGAVERDDYALELAMGDE
ncbi:Ferredoxin C 2 [Lathyrus oleraceus]|uniref:Ferredoxin n=1 Tax=Pisum sativum TaxID=3888 RepID=A0A9D4XCQ0_PEA|nr:Ferredoxin C 2 [Pisum sativum]